MESALASVDCTNASFIHSHADYTSEEAKEEEVKEEEKQEVEEEVDK
jgi:hypothetical protein